jgi:hypothetical protein
MVQGVSENAQAIIERLQPYHAAQPPDNALAILRSLNNIDKHKLLVVALCYAYIPKRFLLAEIGLRNTKPTFFHKTGVIGKSGPRTMAQNFCVFVLPGQSR